MQLFWEIRNQEKSVSAQIWESTKIPVATIWRHSEGNVWRLNEFGFKFRSSLDFGVNLIFVYIPIYKAVYGGKNKTARLIHVMYKWRQTNTSWLTCWNRVTFLEHRMYFRKSVLAFCSPVRNYFQTLDLNTILDFSFVFVQSAKE